VTHKIRPHGKGFAGVWSPMGMNIDYYPGDIFIFDQIMGQNDDIFLYTPMNVFINYTLVPPLVTDELK
jgi:hypothetical protein